MKFSQPKADVYVPSGLKPAAALARTTHLCIGAHQDDIEIMAHAGIAECRRRGDRWFSGVVVTDGAGSPRTGRYARLNDEQMKDVRRVEQRRAAKLGRYSIQIQLAHPSAAVKQRGLADVRSDLHAIFAGCRPDFVYLHNPADKHDTHVAVFLRCLEAIRSLPKTRRPKCVYGCEVWRDLDWLPDAEKVALDASGEPRLARKLLEVFKSQIAGGKRYDIAAIGRRAANATYHHSHATDAANALTFAMNLTSLVRVDSFDVQDYVRRILGRFRADVMDRLKKFR